MHSEVLAALINGTAIIIVAVISLLPALRDKRRKRKNIDSSSTTALDMSNENAVSAQNLTTVSSPMVQQREDLELESLHRRTRIIEAEGLELDRMADEAIITYGSNVQVIMWLHGLGSIFLQLSYPYFGTSVSVLMVVSFFCAFIVAYVVNLNRIEKISQMVKDRQRWQRELQNEIAYFEARTRRTYCNPGFMLKAIRCALTSIGAFQELLRWNDSLVRDAGALLSAMTGLLEMSSNSESNRRKLLFRVAVCAIIYGISLPFMSHYYLFAYY